MVGCSTELRSRSLMNDVYVDFITALFPRPTLRQFSAGFHGGGEKGIKNAHPWRGFHQGTRLR